MNFLIRADASLEIGSGHIMRCIAFGQILKEKGHTIHFITKTDNMLLLERLVKENFTVKIIHKKTNIQQDAIITSRYAKELSVEWVITDGYKFNTEYQKRIKDKGLKLICIDDISKFHFVSDVVINQNINAEKNIRYSREKHTKLLLGLRYLMLRKEYREETNWKRVIKDKCRNILITMGGSDEYNITQKVIDSLQDYPEKLNINIILGFTNEIALDEGIRNENKKLTIKLFRNVENMIPQIRWCDLAICTSGSIVWEMMKLNTPMIVGYVADNQKYSCVQLNKEKLAFGAGDFRKIDIVDLTYVISNVLESFMLRMTVFRNMEKKMCQWGLDLDLWMIFNELVIRNATMKDVELVYKLSNDPKVRRASINKEFIKFEDHKKWFERKIADKNSKFYLILKKNEFVGQVRFDITGDRALISISVTQDFRGKGYSGKVLKLSCNKLFFDSNSVNYIEAFIIPSNISSIKIFEKSGFILEDKVKINNQKLLKYILQR